MYWLYRLFTPDFAWKVYEFHGRMLSMLYASSIVLRIYVFIWALTSSSASPDSPDTTWDVADVLHLLRVHSRSGCT